MLIWKPLRRRRKRNHPKRKKGKTEFHACQFWNNVTIDGLRSRGENVMKKTAWAYYSSGADDEIVSFIFGAIQRFWLTSADLERKPLRLPQDLVPTPHSRGCRKG
jgi:hypothetical protein